MAFVIAVAGKGGVGKTTIAGLLVRLLAERKAAGVLAVDADPNSNLGEWLGVAQHESIGDILDAVSQRPEAVPAGMSKDRFIEYRVQCAVREEKGFDLLTMGRPEGPGCYCYVNNVLRGVAERLIDDYAFAVIDNEAGLEHLSRRTMRRADCLLVVSQATPVSLRAAQRIAGLADALRISVKKKVLLVNGGGRVSRQAIRQTGLPLIGAVPNDPAIKRAGVRGEPLWKLSASSPAVAGLRRYLANIL